jgi:hypothetical protein
MTFILFDFLRRWRWPLLGYAVITVLLGSFMPFNLSALGILILRIESQAGSLRVISMHPVSRRSQAQIWWFIGVLLATLISLPLLIAGMAWQQMRYDPQPVPGVESPWFTVAAVLWSGLGLSALCFLIISTQFGRQVKTMSEQGWAVFKNITLAMLAPACVILPLKLPATPAEMLPWQWLIASLIPLVVMASYLAALRLSLWRKSPLPEMSNFSLSWTIKNGSYKVSSGSTGLILLLKALHGRVLGVMLTVALVSCVVYPWVTGREVNAHFTRQSVMQVLAIALLFSAMVSDQLSLRMLRSMPLSTRHLSLCLLSVPILQGLIMAPFMVLLARMVSGFYPPWLDAVTLAVFIGGLGSFMLTFMCHFTSPWRWVIGIPPLILMPFEILENPRFFPWLLPLGCVLLVGASLWLQCGFWRSPGYYRPRRAFGMNAGSTARQS